MNKVGGEKYLSIWWFLILAIIAGGIVMGVLAFYNAEVNVKESESYILYERVIDCFMDQGFLGEKVLEENFNAGDNITPVTLKNMGIIQTRKGVKNVSVKILGNGSLSKKLTFSGCTVSGSAREQIEKAGGEIA